ncbi:hypothetical protein SAMN05216430_10360 [Limosilactobacillus mucosae]|nr:hypothetical protein SAMN05216430_10360 [Limosilactobacillus mucosae]SEK60947.1 hypothetical protein SAMN05216545_103177 [Limosilactobacillus mucosae]SFK01562.1 hypothetical protein SAMN05216461_103190 [Limosilactobacillus mucosae]
MEKLTKFLGTLLFYIWFVLVVSVLVINIIK